MDAPDWFIIIIEWKKRMGNVGVTLPFLVGALNYKNKAISSQEISSREIIENIINDPIEGYVTEVSLCPDISAPVFSVVKYNNKKSRVVCNSAFYPASSNIESLVFSSNLHGRQGLNCSDKNQCLEKLIKISENHISKKEYSRNRVKGKLGVYEYGDFSDREIEFIESVIMKDDKL